MPHSLTFDRQYQDHDDSCDASSRAPAVYHALTTGLEKVRSSSLDAVCGLTDISASNRTHVSSSQPSDIGSSHLIELASWNNSITDT
jgi:hypothetical protein